MEDIILEPEFKAFKEKYEKNISQVVSFKFSNNEKGNPILKLDQIAPLNNINHMAHDALGDVLATKEIGKILHKNANVIWESGLENSSRSDVQKKINSELLFCYNEFFFGKTKPFLLSFIFGSGT